ncbi:MAG: DUF3800 domain-containing protein [Candidatus Moraniibacteriota bacterium]
MFIDESGNFDFSPKGTKYFSLTAISTTEPLKSREELLKKSYELKYDAWKNDKKDYYLHATEDMQETRDWVFDALGRLDDFEVDSILAEKNKANPSLYIKREIVRKDGKFSLKTIRNEEKFYDKILQILLQYIFSRHKNNDGIEKIVVVLGTLFTNKKHDYILKSLKRYLKEFNKPFFVCFHQTKMDINCQIADYCGWGDVRKERKRGDKAL